MWILTEEYNDYDQYGEYFVYAWPCKPAKEELLKVLEYYMDGRLLDHVYSGGGRTDRYESHWYSFKEFTPWLNK
jgi:hypothetical protein